MTYCQCGRPIESTSMTGYVITTYNGKGEITYAVCLHGDVVINKQDEENNIH